MSEMKALQQQDTNTIRAQHTNINTQINSSLKCGTWDVIASKAGICKHRACVTRLSSSRSEETSPGVCFKVFKVLCSICSHHGRGGERRTAVTGQERCNAARDPAAEAVRTASTSQLPVKHLPLSSQRASRWLEEQIVILTFWPLPPSGSSRPSCLCPAEMKPWMCGTSENQTHSTTYSTMTFISCIIRYMDVYTHA